MLKNGDEQVVEAGMRLRNIENNYKGQEREKLRAAAGRLEETHPLLYNRNQWLASKNPSAAAERIGKVAAIIRRLRREHPDEVVGVNLFGGTVRGYDDEAEALASLKDRNRRAEELGLDIRYRMRVK